MSAGSGHLVCGVVLAAGAGTRFGGPKALARDEHGRPWVAIAVDALLGGGCSDVVVVLGAGADAAASLVPPRARTVVAADWAGGLSRSLAAGLEAAAGADAAVILPVDTPGVVPSAVARVVAAAAGVPADTGGAPDSAATREALVRAVYRGRPGHPVLIGAAHWPALAAELSGDAGAGAFLSRRGAREVECADLWAGDDRDRP